MRVIADSNVVVSAILNKNSKTAQLLIFGRRYFDFFAPNLLKLEIKKHKAKLLEVSKLSSEEFDKAQDELFECLTFISEEQIDYEHWHNAIPVVRDIDMDDIAFVALAEYLDCQLWTGDKRLLQGIQQRGYRKGITTDELYQIWLDNK
jgi:predicted nucleic acid-binding protein